ncbi:MAG: hypothetical protein Q8Q14_10915 [Gemmatimonadales bacterium]|nr:hypothetical protein [Gemmatimonadales bacterium]
MSPRERNLAVAWLRESAVVLLRLAGGVESNFGFGANPLGGGAAAARYVADKYRKAAVLLEDAATDAAMDAEDQSTPGGDK